MAEELVRGLHLNPSSRYPRAFLHLAEQATPAHLWVSAAGAAAYALIHFVEAYGLWRQRLWAEWFAVLSGGVYVPWEIWELSRGLTWPRLTLLAANLCIVCYLVWLLKSARSRAASRGSLPKSGG